MPRQYYVYIISNKRHTVFYAGITSNLRKRIYEHRQKFVGGFTKKYNIYKLLYYEIFQTPNEAILREKQLKDFRREKKFILINEFNPQWRDLSDEISQG